MKTEHRGLLFDYSEAEPDFVNDQGTKWWRTDVFNTQLDQIKHKIKVFLAEAKDGSKEYVVVDEQGVLYASTNFEFVGAKLDQYYLTETHNG